MDLIKLMGMLAKENIPASSWDNSGVLQLSINCGTICMSESFPRTLNPSIWRNNAKQWLSRAVLELYPDSKAAEAIRAERKAEMDEVLNTHLDQRTGPTETIIVGEENLTDAEKEEVLAAIKEARRIYTWTCPKCGVVITHNYSPERQIAVVEGIDCPVCNSPLIAQVQFQKNKTKTEEDYSRFGNDGYTVKQLMEDPDAVHNLLLKKRAANAEAHKYLGQLKMRDSLHNSVLQRQWFEVSKDDAEKIIKWLFGEASRDVPEPWPSDMPNRIRQVADYLKDQWQIGDEKPEPAETEQLESLGGNVFGIHMTETEIPPAKVVVPPEPAKAEARQPKFAIGETVYIGGQRMTPAEVKRLSITELGKHYEIKFKQPWNGLKGMVGVAENYLVSEAEAAAMEGLAEKDGETTKA
jgi:hypothetical protein